MLSDDHLELLTAYVDGELSPRRGRAVRRLLQRSAEARELVRQLQEDARRVKGLPARPVEPSLVPEILQVLAGREPPVRRPAPVRRSWRPYLAAGLAASLLIAAVGGVYRYAADTAGAPVPSVAAVAPKPADRPEPEPSRKAPNPLIARVTSGVYSQFGAPIPPDRTFSVAFAELRGEGTATGQLAYELGKDRAVQLDVVVKDNPLALERLRSALHDHGIKIVLDPETSQALKKAPAGEYWVYAENIHPDELTKMLKELSKDDNKMKAFARTPFERLTVGTLAGPEKDHLAGKLGVDPAKLEPQALPAAAKAPGRWERQAVVLPARPADGPSAEVRRFLEQRTRPQPGAVQVLVKIRQEK